MKSVLKELEKAISKAKKYEKAQEVADKLMQSSNDGDLVPDKIWAKWERALLSALVLHCAVSPNGELSLERIQQFVSAVDPEKAIKDAMARPDEKEAIKQYEITIGLNPDLTLTKKMETLARNRWMGTTGGLAGRMSRLRGQPKAKAKKADVE